MLAHVSDPVRVSRGLISNRWFSGLWFGEARRRSRMPSLALALTALGCLLTTVMVATLSAPAKAQDAEPDHIRGVITAIENSAVVLETKDGQAVRIAMPDGVGVFSLSEGSFTDVDFGVYVGAVSVKLDEYSPIVRDSLSWLHQGFELRIIDEKLRGIAVGHTDWDLTSNSVMTHGWVDDQETRVLSIKFGPTEAEETDVEVARDVPVLKMGLGDESLIRTGAYAFVGANKNESGDYVAVFLFIGEDGIVPPL